MRAGGREDAVAREGIVSVRARVEAIRVSGVEHVADGGILISVQEKGGPGGLRSCERRRQARLPNYLATQR